jgi:hypothetical protein
MCCFCCRRQPKIQFINEPPKYIIDALNIKKRVMSQTDILEDLVDDYIRVASYFNKRNIYDFTYKLNNKFNYLMYLEMKLKSFKITTKYQEKLYQEYKNESNRIDLYFFPKGVKPRGVKEASPVLYHFTKPPVPAAVAPEEKDFRQINSEDYTGLMIETVQVS